VDHHISKTNSWPSASISLCLDETVLQNFKALEGKDDPEIFTTVVHQFLANLPRHFEGIKPAIDHQDPDALMKAAHACKGSCRLIGAISLAEVSYALELMGREESWKASQRTLSNGLRKKTTPLKLSNKNNHLRLLCRLTLLHH
jgi:HPt (histidine-containing phosphotransfer) domain-containing protein